MLYGLAQVGVEQPNTGVTEQVVLEQVSWLQSVGGIITPYLPVFFVAFLGALIATPLMRRLAIHHGIVDKPNVARKIHKAPVAYLGGVAIFAGMGAGCRHRPLCTT